MDTFSDYVMEQTTGSRCATCGEPVWMVMQREVKPNAPKFYICFECMKVSEIGVGPVLSALSYCRIDKKYPDCRAATITCFVCGEKSSDPKHVGRMYCPGCREYHTDRALVGEDPARRRKPVI